MFLNDRKIKILEAIINDYIHTAEPIGSRTIAKKYDLGISSATIRNEMSDLEEMGLIMQPHASSGRVPSDKGYRMYVDRQTNYRDLTHEELGFLRKTIGNNITQMDFLIQETAKAIALLTNYTTIVSEPYANKIAIKHVQLMPLDETSVVLALITDAKVVKNHVLHMQNPPEYEMLIKVSTLINQQIKNHTLTDAIPKIAKELKAQLGLDETFLAPIVEAMYSTIRTEEEVQVYTSGVRNMLGYPEFSDIDKARALFQTLEEKELLITLLDNTTSDKIQITIGTENNVEQMKDCSLIKTSYMINNKQAGSIGIIGPTRMDYVEVVSVLNGIVKNVNKVIQTLSGG